MSSDISNDPKKIFGRRLRVIREGLNLKQSEFSQPLGIQEKTLSAIELGKSNTSESVLNLLESNYRINRKWLQLGEEPIFLQIEAENTSQESPYDLEINELLEGTRRVLLSGNKVAAEALSRNIRYFSQAIDAEKKLGDTTKRLEQTEEKLDKTVNTMLLMEKRLERMEKADRHKAGCQGQEVHKGSASDRAANNR